MVTISQIPNPGERKVFFRGDIVVFRVKLSKALIGKAYLRTNINNARVRRKELIDYVTKEIPISSQGWRDIQMERVSDIEYKLEIALIEVGHFEAISLFIEGNKTTPIWAGSENTAINVEPAEYCCANSLYCAFPRQFGPNKYSQKSQVVAEMTEEKMSNLDNKGFTVIPFSGTFRNLTKELDFIINELNCRIIHLLPITPTPTVYGKMGRFGSPYASLDFTNIDPSLAEFDRKSTPLEQFLELVHEIHNKNAKLIIDIAINHVGWAAKLHEEHPEWLLRESDKTIVSPGAWGVIWGDLTELDHKNSNLWEYLANVFIIWTGRGVDGFRCDAGYMIPHEAWEFIISKVRMEYPDTIFLLEGLGGDPQITANLLNTANMNWAYSELFQNYTKQQIESYMFNAQRISFENGLLIHYAETHDNSRLAAVSKTYAKMRTGLCALLSFSGGFGFTNGVEWLATERIDVHNASALNWGSNDNIVDHIKRINTILIAHPSFYGKSTLSHIDTTNNNIIAFLRHSEDKKHNVAIIINLNCNNDSSCIIQNYENFKFENSIDLLSGKKFKITDNKIHLAQGEVLCLSDNENDIRIIENSEKNKVLVPDRIEQQRARALALELTSWRRDSSIIEEGEARNIENRIFENPEEFYSSLFTEEEPVLLTKWVYPRDLNRVVMLPKNHSLMMISKYRFRIKLLNNGEVLEYRGSLKAKSGLFFYIMPYFSWWPKGHTPIKLEITTYKNNNSITETSEILLIEEEIQICKTRLISTEIKSNKSSLLDTNTNSSMCYVDAQWGTVRSKYNAILAANIDANVPTDKIVMLTRCRSWVLYQGRSVELNINNTACFKINVDGGGTWDFRVPIGGNLYIDISIAMSLLTGKNATRISFYRHSESAKANLLPDSKEVQIIVRPDIEDRNFHNTTKLYGDYKEYFNQKIKANEKGFIFAPEANRKLALATSKGEFLESQEFNFNIYYPFDEERGMKESGDLFSPGYFVIPLNGNDQAEILAEVKIEANGILKGPKDDISFRYLETATNNNADHILLRAMRKFIVNRNSLKTIIAGYPWFLDWGRDTLICARGLIAAGYLKEVKDIILEFAMFEKDGTLPNIIHGNKVGNFDTSDAPLWFIATCKSYCESLDSEDILNQKTASNRSILEVIKSIVSGYLEGTSNGIKVDTESMLVFSPTHFTWMDTNYPAGTPREGYPIEIQALWYNALSFLAKVERDNTKWKEIAQQVRKSVSEMFIKKLEITDCFIPKKYLADCLHSKGFSPAKDSEADDHIRPNQLLAITLGLIDDRNLTKDILDITSELLIPGAIRSLADRPTHYALKIYANNSANLLNNPNNPYWGEYTGDEDTKRKPAYHNGTAWVWQFPSYCEAYFMTYGTLGKEYAKILLSTTNKLMDEQILGQMPELLDGNAPHKQKGCYAQAWSITESYRVWKILHT